MSLVFKEHWVTPTGTVDDASAGGRVAITIKRLGGCFRCVVVKGQLLSYDDVSTRYDNNLTKNANFGSQL